MTGFWRGWLTCWCVIAALFGAVLVLAGVPGNERLTIGLFTSFGQAPTIVEPALRFATALMGAVTLGWALCLWVGFRAAPHLPAAVEWRFWRGTAIAALVWYVVDSSLSVMTGFPLNAVSNTILMAGLLLPLWASGAMRLSTAS